VSNRVAAVEGVDVVAVVEVQRVEHPLTSEVLYQLSPRGDRTVARGV
jgi:hypothetical protein